MNKDPIVTDILTYIRRNRVSTTEVADCLGKSGALEGLMSVNRGHFASGIVRYVYGFNESNWSIHEQIRDVRVGEVVFMDGINVKNRALAGALVSKFLLLYKEASAVVALGRMRDANDLIKNNMAVWCNGFTPIGCYNCHEKISDEVQRIARERKDLYDGALAICDDTGVVCVPKKMLTRAFYEKLQQIEQQEDEWFHCIDVLKWDTYDTVCLRKYQEEVK